MPPLFTKVASCESGVAVSRTASTTWLIDQVGCAASTRATVAVTKGAAIEVPLSLLTKVPFRDRPLRLEPGAAICTDWRP